MSRALLQFGLVLFTFIGTVNQARLTAQNNSKGSEAVQHFLILATSADEALLNNSLEYIEDNWKPGFEIMLVETLYFSLNREIANDLSSLLERKTAQNYGSDVQKWHQWLWNKPASYGPEYFEFKAILHSYLDPRFENYFSQRNERSTIRLDEVIWGGVKQDGIPPLRNPQMINVSEAEYLRDNDIVFGIEVNGDARAYPKRILAWHEMFTDTVGGIAVAGVYCTLCGTVILYETKIDDHSYELGTSGFLYRSNKLMYDRATQSLWSTLEGEPVIGPLVGKNIRLPYRSVVTTSWGTWKTRHPETSVLSLDTGHSRNYGEGVAYREYFATDELMFQVPEIDARLKNKDEILAIRLPEITDKSLAISSKFLIENPVYPATLAGVRFTVFTDRSGAHRAYLTEGLVFKEYDGFFTAVDQEGGAWELKENELRSSNKAMPRIPSYNAFWFGFKAAFPDTELIR